MTWDTYAFYALIIAIILIILSLVIALNQLRVIKKVKENINFKLDSLKSNSSDNTGIKYVYNNLGESKEYIDQYIISFETTDVFLVTRLVQTLAKNSLMTIDCFNINEKYINSIKLDFNKETNLIPLIKLNKKTMYINLTISKNSDINLDLRRPHKKIYVTYKRLSLLVTSAFFFLLVYIANFLLNILAQGHLEYYVSNDTLILALITITVFSLLSYLLTRLILKKAFRIRGFSK